MKTVVLGLFVAMGLVAGLMASGLTSQGSLADPMLPCRNNGVCPDLQVVRTDLLDQRVQLKQFRASDCEVIEGSTVAGRRRLLRFTTTYVNTGPGDLIVGDPRAAENRDFFEFSSCHGHYHFQEYADYRLWTLTGYDEWDRLRTQNPHALSRDLLARISNLAAKMVRGDKQGFCMIDIVQIVPFSPGPNFTNCNTDQGISVGWADVYDKSLPGQYIDITALPGGSYWLEVEVNAEHLLQEADYQDNSAAVQVRVK